MSLPVRTVKGPKAKHGHPAAIDRQTFDVTRRCFLLHDGNTPLIDQESRSRTRASEEQQMWAKRATYYVSPPSISEMPAFSYESGNRPFPNPTGNRCPSPSRRDENLSESRGTTLFRLPISRPSPSTLTHVARSCEHGLNANALAVAMTDSLIDGAVR